MKFMYVQMEKRGAARCLLNYGKVCSYFKGSSPVNHEHQIDFVYTGGTKYVCAHLSRSVRWI